MYRNRKKQLSGQVCDAKFAAETRSVDGRMAGCRVRKEAQSELFRMGRVGNSGDDQGRLPPAKVVESSGQVSRNDLRVAIGGNPYCG